MPKKTKSEMEKLFKDSKTYSDDLVLDLGGGASLTLGELRQFNTETGGDLLKQVEAERLKLAEDRGKVQKASEEVANLYLALEDQKKKIAQNKPAAAADPLADLMSTDPLAKLVAEMREENKRNYDLLKGELEKTNKNLIQAGRTYMNDYAQTEFEKIKSDPDFDSDINLDGVFDYAVKRGL